MAKKIVPVKKKRVPTQSIKKSQRPITRTFSEVKVEKVLVENFVSLQKVMTNLSVKFDNLASQISKLLELFEISAKALAKKDFNLEKEGKDNKKIIEKIDNLFEQNKIIARGLTLLHEPTPQNYPPKQIPKQMQKPFQVQRQDQEQKISTTGYQKSISSKTQESNQLSEQ